MNRQSKQPQVGHLGLYYIPLKQLLSPYRIEMNPSLYLVCLLPHFFKQFRILPCDAVIIRSIYFHFFYIVCDHIPSESTFRQIMFCFSCKHLYFRIDSDRGKSIFLFFLIGNLSLYFIREERQCFFPGRKVRLRNFPGGKGFKELSLILDRRL